jgi:hypothetical protein
MCIPCKPHEAQEISAHENGKAVYIKNATLQSALWVTFCIRNFIKTAAEQQCTIITPLARIAPADARVLNTGLSLYE